MGTFNIIKPSSIGTVVGGRGNGAGTIPGWESNGVGSTDANLCDGLILGLDQYLALANTGISNSSIEFGMDQSTNIFELDGSPAISFNNLPSGFTITSGILTINLNSNFAGTFTCGYGFNPSFQQINDFTGNQGFVSYEIVLSTNISALQFLLNKISIAAALDTTFAVPPGTILGLLSLLNYSFTGTYEIQAVVISPISIENTSPARVGDKIIINSTLPILLGATQIQLTYPGHEIILDLLTPSLTIDGVIYYWLNFVFIQTDFQIQFYLPFGFGRFAGLVTVTLIGNGTQFSGSVLAGVLNVLYADASGIYSLTEGQTNDTLYFRDGYTTDIKFLFLNSENEIYDDNYFSMKQERLRMLAMNDFEYEDYEDYEDNFFTITGALRIPVTTIETEIPSPFVMTAFLP
jgi:hypothetical protein